MLLGQQVAGGLICAAVIVAAAESLPEARAVWLSLLAGTAGALALGAFYRALALGTMSIVAPISASGVVVPVAVGIASGDRPSAVQALAIPVIFAGVILASREVSGPAEERSGSRSSIVLALLAALAFGVYFSITDAVAEDSVLWLLLLGRGAAVALLVAFLLARPPAVRPRPPDLLALTAIGALYPIATVLLARLILGERLRREQQAGVALAFAGVAAVAAG